MLYHGRRIVSNWVLKENTCLQKIWSERGLLEIQTALKEEKGSRNNQENCSPNADKTPVERDEERKKIGHIELQLASQTMTKSPQAQRN